jgi:hypothetical protein
MQQNTKTFSLLPSENIFLKDDNNKPVKYLRRIDYMTWFIRLSFLLIILINLLTFLLGPFTIYSTIDNQATRVLQVTTMNIKMMESYNYLVDAVLMDEGHLNKLFFLPVYKNHLYFNRTPK